VAENISNHKVKPQVKISTIGKIRSFNEINIFDDILKMVKNGRPWCAGHHTNKRTCVSGDAFDMSDACTKTELIC
jgi:hypothetical protein